MIQFVLILGMLMCTAKVILGFPEVGNDELRFESAQYKATVLHSDPLLIQFDGFLSASEADFLVTSANRSLERSIGGMDRKVSDSWLRSGTVLVDPIHDAIIERIANVVKLPVDNQEHFQVLKYDPGDFYNVHHDYIPEMLDSACGPRIATFFVYLNDVKEGGATSFPDLEIDVQPVKGRALLWYNAKNTNPISAEPRTRHAATKPTSGVKWIANKWIHSKDFITPFLSGSLASLEKPQTQQLQKDPNACVDLHKFCPDWAKADECLSNPTYMLKHCKKSCKFCDVTKDTKEQGREDLLPDRTPQKMVSIEAGAECCKPSADELADQCETLATVKSCTDDVEVKEACPCSCCQALLVSNKFEQLAGDGYESKSSDHGKDEL